MLILFQALSVNTQLESLALRSISMCSSECRSEMKNLLEKNYTLTHLKIRDYFTKHSLELRAIAHRNKCAISQNRFARTKVAAKHHQ